MRWGMAIDLRRCVGCQTCTIACKQEHALPAGTAWRFVADCEVGEYPDVRRVFLPMQCMHCADPACVPACPTGASRQRDDGIVWVEYGACVGCGYCAMACPYHARHLVHAATGYFAEPTAAERVTSRPGRAGVMTKCTFCKDRIDAGLARGLTPGVDPDATPMCAVACIAGAIVFGDVSDPASPVSRLIRDTGAVPLSPESGTRPNVYYATAETVALATTGRTPSSDAREERTADAVIASSQARP
jgi:phenylacetyl-CoA:acceptor oxidoreductase subunit 1